MWDAEDMRAASPMTARTRLVTPKNHVAPPKPQTPTHPPSLILCQMDRQTT
jgi:hypothetical protein